MAIEIQEFSDSNVPKLPAPSMSREERPTSAKLQDFLSEMVTILRDKINTQNSKIDRMRVDLSQIKQNDLEGIKRSLKELDQKLAVLEKKIDMQKAEVDSRILDNLRKA